MQAQELWHTGFVVLRHVGSSQTRDQIHVPFIGRWILNQWTTKEAPLASIFNTHQALEVNRAI